MLAHLPGSGKGTPLSHRESRIHAVANIRDFIYLDWERIRSFVAQADRGVPETRTGSISDEHESTTEARLSLFGSVSGVHSDDARYSRSSTETRSLHHAVFTDFEKYLEDSGLLREAGSWERANLADGGFFRVSGLIRLVDYAAVVALMRGLKGLMGTIIGMQRSQVRGDGSLTQQQKQRRMSELDNELKGQKKLFNDFGIDSVASVVEQLYGDVVRVKVVPDADNPDQVFVGTCDPEAIDPGFRRAIGSRGYSTLWALESLVFVEPIAKDAAPELVPTGNDMEDAIDILVGEMDSLARVASGYEFPAVSCTPLAIYRVLAST